MTELKTEWKSARELFALESIEGKVIFRPKGSVHNYVALNPATDELVIASQGYPVAKFDLYEATDWVAGQASFYEFNILK